MKETKEQRITHSKACYKRNLEEMISYIGDELEELDRSEFKPSIGLELQAQRILQEAELLVSILESKP